ncbi:MFS transporter [Patulibacter sp.]|uniref:MFS transporter n=1 Tax=Patulibacter sp. TaxID=1912859 RepID=UPI002726B077|nr:MFS transporter [Patulibacter sp.]MDO9408977.1 MFS transporter [Patulibacter sp.]
MGLTGDTAAGTGPAAGTGARRTTPGTSPLVDRRLRVGYGVGSVGTGIVVTVPGLLLLYYLTDVLGVAAGLAGVLLVLPKAWDVVLAPLVGRALDRGERRARWMRRAAWALPPAFALLFLSPVDGTLGGLWVGAWFVVLATAFAFFQVPYIALPARMTDDPAERTRTMSWRVALLAVGILVSGGLGPVLAGGDAGSRGGHALMGIVLGLVLLAALTASARATAGVPDPPAPAGTATPSLRVSLRTAWDSPPFRLLAVVYALQALAVAVLLAGAPYVATYRLDDHGLTSVMFVALIAPSLVVVPLWRRAADRRGKSTALLGATVLFLAAVVVLTLAARAGAVAPTLVLCGVLGAAYAGLQLLPLSLLPDVTVAESERLGRPVTGAFTGVWAAGETAGAALGPGVYALVLAAAGFASSDADERVAQSATAVDAVLLGWTAGPVLLGALSLLVLLRLHRLLSSPTPKADR